MDERERGEHSADSLRSDAEYGEGGNCSSWEMRVRLRGGSLGGECGRR